MTSLLLRLCYCIRRSVFLPGIVHDPDLSRFFPGHFLFDISSLSIYAELDNAARRETREYFWKSGHANDCSMPKFQAAKNEKVGSRSARGEKGRNNVAVCENINGQTASARFYAHTSSPSERSMKIHTVARRKYPSFKMDGFRWI